MSSSNHLHNPDLSVLLLTRDAGERFREVMGALFECRGIERSEVLVVDSGSTDETVEIAAARTGVRVHRIAPEEFRHGRTRNLAASLSRAPILVFLVQDATPADSGFLEELTAAFHQDPNMAATYGRQIARPEADPIESAFLAYNYPATPHERHPLNGGRRVTLRSIFFSNVCSAVRRDVWVRFPFDEELIMSEDQKWAREVLEAGYRIAYRPSAVVYHSHHYGLVRLAQRNFDSGYSLVGIIQDPWYKMVGDEIRFVARTAADLWRRGHGHWIPWLLLYESARSLGFALGRHSERLPCRLRRRLSLHQEFWTGR